MQAGVTNPSKGFTEKIIKQKMQSENAASVSQLN